MFKWYCDYHICWSCGLCAPIHPINRVVCEDWEKLVWIIARVITMICSKCKFWQLKPGDGRNPPKYKSTNCYLQLWESLGNKEFEWWRMEHQKFFILHFADFLLMLSLHAYLTSTHSDGNYIKSKALKWDTMKRWYDEAICWCAS